MHRLQMKYDSLSNHESLPVTAMCVDCELTAAGTPDHSDSSRLRPITYCARELDLQKIKIDGVVVTRVIRSKVSVMSRPYIGSLLAKPLN